MFRDLSILKYYIFMEIYFFLNLVTLVAGWADLPFLQNGGMMLMKNHFDFKDIMTFGLFLLALLTFIFNFCK